MIRYLLIKKKRICPRIFPFSTYTKYKFLDKLMVGFFFIPIKCSIFLGILKKSSGKSLEIVCDFEKSTEIVRKFGKSSEILRKFWNSSEILYNSGEINRNLKKSSFFRNTCTVLFIEIGDKSYDSFCHICVNLAFLIVFKVISVT